MSWLRPASGGRTEDCYASDVLESGWMGKMRLIWGRRSARGLVRRELAYRQLHLGW